MAFNLKTKKSLNLAGSFLFLLLIAALLIIAACVGLTKTYGWFAQNETVFGNGMSVKANSDLFELAVPLSSQQLTAFSDQSALVTYVSTNEDIYHVSETDFQHQGLLCAMNDEKSGSNDHELKPGDFGTISFDIVPKVSGDLELEINFDFKAFSASGYPEVLTEIPANSDAYQLLQGHMLFFRTRSPAPGSTVEYYYSDRIDGTIYFNTADNVGIIVNGETHYRVTIYWIWPYTFAQMVFPENDYRLHSHTVCNDTEDREELIDHIIDNKDLYFYDYQGNDLDTDFTTEADAGTYFLELSEAYNNADQVIGDSVKYLVTLVRVSPANQTPVTP